MTKDRFRFRVWDTEKKEMIYGAEFTYDYMYPCLGGKIIEENCFGDVLENKRYIVEQCTGLKDKNGRLIYENDIIKITEGVLPVDPKYVDCLFKAIWIDIGFCLETLNGKDGLDFCECWEYEVVGNLHENPELLVVKETTKETVYKEPEIRDGWFVYEAGQNPLCCYWYCTLCSFDLKDKDGYACTVSVEGCTTFNQAVEQANKLAEELENASKN